MHTFMKSRLIVAVVSASLGALAMFVAIRLTESTEAPRSELPKRDGLPTRVGTVLLAPLKPAQRIVRDYIIKYAPDPQSVEFIEWYDPVSAKNSTSYVRSDTAVRVVYRTRNPIGGMSVLERIYYIKGGKVVHEVYPDSGFIELWQNELHYLYGEPPPRDLVEERMRGLLPNVPPGGQVDLGVPRKRP